MMFHLQINKFLCVIFYFFDVFFLSCQRCRTNIALNACMCKILYKRSKKCNVKGVEDTLYRFWCIKCYVCQRCRRWCLQLLRNTVCRVQILCWRCQRYSVLCIQWPLTLPGGKAHCSCTVCPVGLAVHHQSVWGSSFVKFLGLVKLQWWLQARCTANPQFLKLRGCSATQ